MSSFSQIAHSTLEKLRSSLSSVYDPANIVLDETNDLLGLLSKKQATNPDGSIAIVEQLPRLEIQLIGAMDQGSIDQRDIYTTVLIVIIGYEKYDPSITNTENGLKILDMATQVKNKMYSMNTDKLKKMLPIKGFQRVLPEVEVAADQLFMEGLSSFAIDVKIQIILNDEGL